MATTHDNLEYSFHSCLRVLLGTRRIPDRSTAIAELATPSRPSCTFFALKSVLARTIQGLASVDIVGYWRLDGYWISSVGCPDLHS